MKKLLFFFIFLLVSYLNTYSQEIHIDTITNNFIDVLDEDKYSREVVLDSIVEGSIFSEYIGKGMLTFNTCRDIQPWIDTLFLALHKTESVKESYSTTYYWRNKRFHKRKDITIVCDISEEKEPNYFQVRLTLLDPDLQLISDDEFLTTVKKQIERLVFSQPIVKTYQASQPTISTIGKNPYFSFWTDIPPVNYKSVVALLAQDTTVQLKWEKLTVRCLIDTTGKIARWKPVDPPENIDENQFQQQLAKYKNMFTYPVMHSPNNKTANLPYLLQFQLNNTWQDSINKENIQRDVLEILQTNQYSKYNRSKERVIENTTTVGNTTFFSVSEDELSPLIADIPFNQKSYSFYFDGKYVYTFQKNNNTWLSHQTIETSEEFEGMDTDDINHDGYPDIILYTSSNMNGNRWNDIYVYNALKDSFLIAAVSFCCMFTIEDTIGNYQPNHKYLVTSYNGSWYMPATTSIYSWQNNVLHLEAIFGTEKLRCDMGNIDYDIFFVMRNIDGNMKITKQINIGGAINIRGAKKFSNEAAKIVNALFEEYFD